MRCVPRWTFHHNWLAEFYGVSVDYILELTDVREPYPKRVHAQKKITAFEIKKVAQRIFPQVEHSRIKCEQNMIFFFGIFCTIVTYCIEFAQKNLDFLCVL